MEERKKNAIDVRIVSANNKLLTPINHAIPLD